MSEAEINDDFGIQPLTQTLDDLLGEFATHTIFKVVQAGKIVGSVRTLFKDERIPDHSVLSRMISTRTKDLR